MSSSTQEHENLKIIYAESESTTKTCGVFGISTAPPPSPTGSAKSRSSGGKNTNAFARWLLPTSDNKCRRAEEALLREGNLPLDDPSKCRQFNVPLGDGTDPLRFINTIILDQAGLDAPASERTRLVIVNGLGAAVGVFFQNLEPLSRMIPNVRIWAIDWLGMGRSGRPPFPKSPSKSKPIDGIRFFLDSFEDWRSKQEGLDSFILLGHSLGGYLSTIYALWHPNRVERLLLASPAGIPANQVTPELEETLGGPVAVNGQVIPAWIGWLWNRNYTPQCLLRHLGPIGPPVLRHYISSRFTFMDKHRASLFTEYMYHITADVGSGEFALGTLMTPGAWAKEPLHDRLAGLTMPVSFVYGKEDWMDNRYTEEYAHNLKVPYTIQRIPDCGHQLYLEQPDAFNKWVADECIADKSVI